MHCCIVFNSSNYDCSHICVSDLKGFFLNAFDSYYLWGSLTSDYGCIQITIYIHNYIIVKKKIKHQNMCPQYVFRCTAIQRDKHTSTKGWRQQTAFENLLGATIKLWIQYWTANVALARHLADSIVSSFVSSTLIIEKLNSTKVQFNNYKLQINRVLLLHATRALDKRWLFLFAKQRSDIRWV